jgi:hypothetical protein
MASIRRDEAPPIVILDLIQDLFAFVGGNKKRDPGSSPG